MDRPGNALMKAMLHAHETTMRNLQGAQIKQPGRIQAGPYRDGYREPAEARKLTNRQFGPAPGNSKGY